MSEDLADEVEALNSIYGEGTLTQSAEENDIYILNLPGELSSLRLQFPPEYPAAPPTALGTHSSGHRGKRGTAARDLDLFLAALGTVYEPGQVCLFDAIEEVTRLAELAGEGEAEPSKPAPTGEEVHEAAFHPQGGLGDGPEPPWILSDLVVEMKSTFVARCAAVASPDEANRFLGHLLASDRKVRDATHNITAWRIRGENNTSFQDCNDDGETAAGGRLLHLMQLMDLWNVMVVVTRWFGGQKLGPRRFALINQAARDAFVKAGLVEGISAKKKTHGK